MLWPKEQNCNTEKVENMAFGLFKRIQMSSVYLSKVQSDFNVVYVLFLSFIFPIPTHFNYFELILQILIFWTACVVEFLPVETAEPDFPVETAGVDPRRVSNKGSIDERRDLFCQNKTYRLSTSNVYKCFRFKCFRMRLIIPLMRLKYKLINEWIHFIIKNKDIWKKPEVFDILNAVFITKQTNLAIIQIRNVN